MPGIREKREKYSSRRKETAIDNDQRLVAVRIPRGYKACCIETAKIYKARKIIVRFIILVSLFLS